MSRRALPSLAALLLVLASCGTLRPKEPNRTLQVDTTGSHFSSSNGYLFAVLDDSQSKLARVDVRYPVGSANDPVGKEGLAHLVEHLLYEMEIVRDGKTTSIIAETRRLTSYYNAQTGRDYIHFEAQGLPEAMPELLRLEAERATLGCQAISADVFEREKEVVLNELRQRLGVDGGDLFAEFSRALFPEGHPYQRVNTVESVSGIVLQDVCDFLTHAFQQGRATVVVSGAVDEAKVRAVVGSAFKRIPNRKLKDVTVTPAVIRPKGPKIQLQADVPEGIVMLAWPLPPEGTREYRFALMARYGMAARLGSFAYTYGWGHGANTWIAGGGRAPFLILQVTVRSMKHVSEAVSAARKSLRYGFRTIRVPGEDKDSRYWQRRLVREEARLISRYENLASRAHMISGYLLYEEGMELLVGKLKELRATTPEVVRSAAEKWLSPGKAQVIVIEPSQVLGRGLTVGKVFSSSHDTSHAIAVDPNEADTPIDLPATTGLSLQTIRYKTPNGLSVVLWPHGEMPLLHGRLVTASGAAIGAEGHAAASGFDSVYQDSMVYRESQSSTVIDQLLSDVTVELANPGYSVSDETRMHLRSRLGIAETEAELGFERRMREALFGEGHAYARAGFTLHGINGLTTDQVRGWARKHVVPNNSTLIVAGKLDLTEAKNWIAFLTDQISPGNESEPVMPGQVVRVPGWIGGRGREQSPVVHVDIRFAGAAGIDDMEGVRSVLREVLSLKLKAIREEHAISYGLSVSYIAQQAGGYWRISGSIDARRAAEAGKRLQETINHLRQGPSGYRGDFVLSRRKRVDGLLAGASDSRSVASRLETMARFSLADDYYDRLIRTIANLTPIDVAEVVSLELSADRQITGAFGPTAAVEKFLDAAKLASASAPKPFAVPPRASAIAAAHQEQEPHYDTASVIEDSPWEAPARFSDLDLVRGRFGILSRLSYDTVKRDGEFADYIVTRLDLFGEQGLGLADYTGYLHISGTERHVGGEGGGHAQMTMELGGTRWLLGNVLGRLGIGTPLGSGSEEYSAANAASQHRVPDSILLAGQAVSLRASASHFGRLGKFNYRLDAGFDHAQRFSVDRLRTLLRLGAGMGLGADRFELGVQFASVMALLGDAYDDSSFGLTSAIFVAFRANGVRVRASAIVPIDDREFVMALGLEYE